MPNYFQHREEAVSEGNIRTLQDWVELQFFLFTYSRWLTYVCCVLLYINHFFPDVTYYIMQQFTLNLCFYVGIANPLYKMCLKISQTSQAENICSMRETFEKHVHIDPLSAEFRLSNWTDFIDSVMNRTDSVQV